VKQAAPAAKKSTSSSSRPARRTPSASSLTPSLLSNAQFERVEIPPPRGHSKDGIAYTKDFDIKFLKAQRDELIARRQAELARATRLEDEATSIIEDGEMGDVQFDDEGGEGDTMVVQRDLDRLLSTQARQTILDIDAALARIEVGTYGYSSISGMPIPRERLEAIPETTVLAAEKVSGIGPR
jgi:RNA polymerase-binding transcription factor DksA